jgi:Leucine-rich repeat (LRR) protein
LFNASEAAFMTLTTVGGIEALEFEATDLQTPAFNLISNLTSLKRLEAVNCQMLPAQLAAVQNLTNLESLDLMFTVLEKSKETREKLLGPLTDAEMQIRDDLKRRDIGDHVIEAALLTDRFMPCLSHLTKLKQLRLGNTFFSAEGLKHVQPLANLESVDFTPMGLNAETAKPLQAMTKLRSLEYFDVDDGIAATLSRIASLEHLNLWSGGVTDLGASHLAKLKKLKHLEIRGNKITDEGLLQLAHLSELKFLDIQDAARITANGLARFRELRPDVEIKH